MHHIATHTYRGNSHIRDKYTYSRQIHVLTQGKVLIEKGASKVKDTYDTIQAVAIANFDKLQEVLPGNHTPVALMQVFHDLCTRVDAWMRGCMCVCVQERERERARERDRYIEAQREREREREREEQRERERERQREKERGTERERVRVSE